MQICIQPTSIQPDPSRIEIPSLGGASLPSNLRAEERDANVFLGPQQSIPTECNVSERGKKRKGASMKQQSRIFARAIEAGAKKRATFRLFTSVLNSSYVCIAMRPTDRRTKRANGRLCQGILLPSFRPACLAACCKCERTNGVASAKVGGPTELSSWSVAGVCRL